MDNFEFLLKSYPIAYGLVAQKLDSPVPRPNHLANHS